MKLKRTWLSIGGRAGGAGDGKGLSNCQPAWHGLETTNRSGSGLATKAGDALRRSGQPAFRFFLPHEA